MEDELGIQTTETHSPTSEQIGDINPFLRPMVEEPLPSAPPRASCKPKFTLSTYSQLKRFMKDETVKIYKDTDKIGIHKDAMDLLLNHLEEYCSAVLMKAYQIRILNKRNRATTRVILTKISIQSALL